MSDEKTTMRIEIDPPYELEDSIVSEAARQLLDQVDLVPVLRERVERGNVAQARSLKVWQLRAKQRGEYLCKIDRLVGVDGIHGTTLSAVERVVREGKESKDSNRILRRAVNTHLKGMKELGAERDAERDRSNVLFRLLNETITALKPFAQAVSQWPWPRDAKVVCSNPDAPLTVCDFTGADFEKACETYRVVTKHPVMDLGGPSKRAMELALGADVVQKTAENFEEVKEVEVVFGRVELSLEARVERLESWAHRISIFASHQDHCAVYTTAGRRCDCGYEQLRTEIRSREEKPDAQP